MSTLAATPTVEDHAYQLPLNDTSLVSFPAMWLAVADACSSVFASLETKVPDDELPEFYNMLNAKMCRAHSLVYRLTAFECADCPALVRGANSARVVGVQQESTQVLVVYYLLRELLKKQLAQTKTRILQHPNRLEGYLRGFEKYTAGVNFVKSAFTYLHWAWQKRGLPAEHIILPTEIIALALWTEHILDREMKEALKNKTAEIVRAFRQGYLRDASAMESVKRLSLSLLLLNDPHQGLHASIIEDPYIVTVVSHFAVEKRRYKTRGPEEYIRTCYEELQREEVKTRCFLGQTSYQKVQQRLVDTLICEETEYLQNAADKWLNVVDDLEAQKSLTILYELLNRGSQKSWMEKAVESRVVTVFTTKDSAAATNTASPVSAATSALECLKYTHNLCRKQIVETFGNADSLLAALERGLNACLKSKATLSPTDIAAQLALFAVDEVHHNIVFAGPEGHWIADMYKLLSEKEVFSRHYITLLRSHLLTERFLSDANCFQMLQSERNMVAQLFIKGTNFDFVSSCNEMIDDVLVRSPRYQALIPSTDANISLFPVVLQRYHWRSLLPSSAGLNMEVPKDVFALARNFMASFSAKHASPGRLLKLLNNYSVVMVRYTFGASNVRAIMTLQEYAVALLFSSQNEWRAGPLATKLHITVPELHQLLKKFVSFGLMTIGETIQLVAYTGTESCLNFNDHISFLKEKIPADPILSVLSGHANLTFSEPALEAFVIKTLKSQGEMKLDMLYGHLQHDEKACLVQKRELKRCIEKLLQRGFVTRNPDADTFAFAP